MLANEEVAQKCNAYLVDMKSNHTPTHKHTLVQPENLKELKHKALDNPNFWVFLLVQAGLKLSLNLWSSCAYLLSAGVTGFKQVRQALPLGQPQTPAVIFWEFYYTVYLPLSVPVAER